jgi:sulfite exporter TauE/SafE
MAGYQQTLSIVLGVLILLTVLIPSRLLAKLTGASFHARIVSKLQHVWAKMFARNSTGSLFVVGILNGFLPCGLVYVALAGSIAMASPEGGALYMALFGLGTVPVMFAMALLGKLVGTGFRSKLRKVVPVVGIVLASLFILRGMSLGIPYISPKLGSTMHGQATMDCCEPGAHDTDSSATTGH